MKNTNAKKKPIYSLMIILLICIVASMALFTERKVNAESTINLDNLTISGVEFDVKKESFAIMINAKIDKASYDAITNQGQEKVKFGLLIGPTKKFDGIEDYATAIEKGYKSFLHVGTPSAVSEYNNDKCVEKIEYNGNATTYTYQAGIIYDNALLSGYDLKEIAKLELTAIPICEVGNEVHLALGEAKSVSPNIELVESYAIEKAEDKENVTDKMIRDYVGNFVNKIGEYYLCQSTNRLMGTTEKGKNLKPIDLSVYSQEDELYVSREKVSLPLTENYIKSLPSDDKYVSLVIYKQDGTLEIYGIKVARRVITRMYDEDAYLNGDPKTNLEDYFAYKIPNDAQGVYPSQASSKGIAYMGIFYNTYSSPKYSYDGLYVLANEITPTTGIHTQNLAGKEPRIVNSNQYQGGPAVEGKGFNGILDGRGNCMDFDFAETSVYCYCGGIFNTMYDATIRNIAFTGLHQYGVSQNYFSNGTHYVNFENVYIHVSGASEFRNNFNQGLLFGDARHCTFKNFVVDCDIFSFEGYSSSKHGQGFRSSGLMLWPYAEGEGAYGYNSATNFFAVGNNPIYLNITNPYNSDLALTQTLTYYMLNEDDELIYNENADKSNSSFKGKKIQENSMTSYYEYQFFDSPTENRFSAINSLIRQAYISRWGEDELYKLENPSSGYIGIEVKFCKTAGFRHVRTKNEFSTYLMKNKEKLNEFNTNGNNCWKVNGLTGQVVWNKMPVYERY